MNVIERIQEYMKLRGWTEYRLVKETKLPASTLANIFHRGTTPSIPTLDHLRCSGHIPQSVFLGQQSGLLDQGTGRSAEQVVHAVAGAKGSSFGTHVEDELRANSGRNRQRTLSVSVISKTGGHTPPVLFSRSHSDTLRRYCGPRESRV